MRFRILSLIVLSLAIPVAAYAQGAASGATAGATGAVVGRPADATISDPIVGVITDANRPRFHEYVIREHIPSNPFSGQIIVGTELPGTIMYYDVPTEFGVKEYRYTVVNNTPVLVDPHTHRVVQIIG